MNGGVSARRSRLLERFRGRARAAVDAASLAASAGEMELVRRELHKIKGDARMLQLSSLAIYVEQVYEQSKQASPRLSSAFLTLAEWIEAPLVEDAQTRERLVRARFEQARSASADTRASGRVVVVDDSPVMRMMLAASLRARGLEVETFPSGEQTLSALTKRRPQVILSDVEMPGLSGLELLERVRATNPNLPVVLLSGDVGEKQQKRAAELGAAGLFRKSADLSAVIDQVLLQCRGANAPQPDPAA